jgi:hypothetical protein
VPFFAIERFVEGPRRVSRTRSFTVVAQDPSVSVSKKDTSVLTGIASIPTETYLPGPRGSRFHVVDVEMASGKVGVALEMTGGEEPETDPVAIAAASRAFGPAARAQNVYVVAARTLARFEQALGRRVPWSFAGHQLFLVPAAMEEAQAYYDPPSHSILFGAYGGKADGSGREYTCLSHDVVAHETTHAVLDGLRHRFTEPGLPDQAAFHEAFADIVALLSIFSLKGVPRRLLDRAGVGDWLPAEMVSEGALVASPLFGLAEQLGASRDERRGEALRRSVSLPPSTTYLDLPAYQEPHARGEVLVAAVAQAFLRIWTSRLVTLHADGSRVSAERAAEEGAKSADHLLSMCIRAIDYTPPIEFIFADFLDSILAADREVAPDDEHHYRGSLTQAFADYGISGTSEYDRDVTMPDERLDYAGLHLDELKDNPDEVFRFVWDNARALDLHTEYFLSVESVVPARRVGPDGFVVYESAASYVQLLDGTAADLAKLAESQGGTFQLPDGLDGSTPIQIQGGGALIFDEFGRAKFHQRKSIFDWDRQSARLNSLVKRSVRDTRDRLGFSVGGPRGAQFRLLHVSSDIESERW